MSCSVGTVLDGRDGVWLRQNVLRYQKIAGRFLHLQPMADGALDLAGLTGVDMNACLLRESGRVCAG